MDSTKACAAIVDFLKNIICQIVDDPSRIEFKHTMYNNKLIISITAYDQSKYIIGKGGKTAESIRKLLDVVASKYYRISGSPFKTVSFEIFNTQEKETKNAD